MVLVRIPQQRLAKQQVNSSQEELFDAPSRNATPRRSRPLGAVPTQASNAVAAAPSADITPVSNLSMAASGTARPIGKPAISPQIQVRVNPNLVKPNIIKQLAPAPVSIFSSRPMPISRRGYEVLPLEAAIPSEILRSPGPALYRGRSFKKRQQMLLYKLSRLIKRGFSRRSGGFGHAHRPLLPAALGGAGILTFLVFISDGPALSLLSDSADHTAEAPQLTEVASPTAAIAEQDLELQIDEDAELFEGGAG